MRAVVSQLQLERVSIEDDKNEVTLSCLMQECTKFISRVDAIELSSNSSVVMERSKIKNLSMSAESQGKLESVSVVCNSVHSDLKSIADKLKKILKENKRATEGKKSSNSGASGDSAAAASGKYLFALQRKLVIFVGI